MSSVVYGLIGYVVLIAPLIITVKILQKRVNQQKQDHMNSLEIIKMTKSVDLPCDIVACFDSVEKYFKDRGLKLNVNMRGYMT